MTSMPAMTSHDQTVLPILQLQAQLGEVVKFRVMFAAQPDTYLECRMKSFFRSTL